jgi:hypothetical protein
MLQEGLAQMQNNVYEAYILKAGSNLFKWDKDRFTTWSLKRVSRCPSDHPLEGNMGTQ